MTDRMPPATLPFWRPKPLDIAAGWVTGHILTGASRAASDDGDRATPLEALERAIIPALERSPCVVTFSGGRDSSLVLAVAVRAARRLGLPLPIAFTNRYPTEPSTDESAWQELVIDHLKIEDWVINDHTKDMDLLSETVTDGLSRHGLIWPPLAHASVRVLQSAAGGAVLTGEGGDEWFGIQRSTALAAMRSFRFRSDLTLMRHALKSIAPRPVRKRAITREVGPALAEWLTPLAREAHLRAVVDDQLSEPLRWDRAIGRLGYRRTVLMGVANRNALASAWDARFVDPIYAPEFTRALQRAGGRLGYRGRTSLMLIHFRGLLPDAVLRRADKVDFGNVVWGERTSEFIHTWNGDGLDTSLVDVDRLAAVWRRGARDGRSAMLVHAAWLAQDGELTE